MSVLCAGGSLSSRDELAAFPQPSPGSGCGCGCGDHQHLRKASGSHPASREGAPGLFPRLSRDRRKLATA